MIYLRRVSGDSMLPTLRPGRLLIIGPLRQHNPIGQVVMLNHNGLDKIKRVTERQQRQSGEQEIFVCGDNESHSTDSRHFGWLPLSVVKGRVIWPRIKIIKPNRQQLRHERN